MNYQESDFDLFERYSLLGVSDGALEKKGYLRERELSAEAQGWRCCYCNVRMFAGIPRECIELYANNMGIELKRRGVWNLDGLARIKMMHVTLEHVIRKSRNIKFKKGVWVPLLASCRWCNCTRHERSAFEWYEEVQKQLKRGEHPHSFFVGK